MSLFVSYLFFVHSLCLYFVCLFVGDNNNVNEEQKLSRWKQILARACLDAGAHIYVAHGDPRLQGNKRTY
jgi:hypothetical protein